MEPDPVAAIGRIKGVGDTALLTAACRAIESRRPGGLLSDPTAVAQLDRLTPILAGSPSLLHRRIAASQLRDSLVAYVAQRARRFDGWARDFGDRHGGGTVVALGCGLDDRLGRIGDARLGMVCVDLPAMIELRRSLVPASAREYLLAASATDPEWMDIVRRRTDGPILVTAEGLLMYLDPAQVVRLLEEMESRLRPSGFAFDTLHRRWLSPLLRRAVDREMHRELGVPPSARFRYGMSESDELERMGHAWRLTEEWSHLDDPDVRPRSLRAFRRIDWVRRVQWSMLYRLEPEP